MIFYGVLGLIIGGLITLSEREKRLQRKVEEARRQLAAEAAVARKQKRYLHLQEKMEKARAAADACNQAYANHKEGLKDCRRWRNKVDRKLRELDGMKERVGGRRLREEREKRIQEYSALRDRLDKEIRGKSALGNEYLAEQKTLNARELEWSKKASRMRRELKDQRAEAGYG
jgi:hypothetical protein